MKRTEAKVLHAIAKNIVALWRIHGVCPVEKGEYNCRVDAPLGELSFFLFRRCYGYGPTKSQAYDELRERVAAVLRMEVSGMVGRLQRAKLLEGRKLDQEIKETAERFSDAIMKGETIGQPGSFGHLWPTRSAADDGDKS